MKTMLPRFLSGLILFVAVSVGAQEFQTREYTVRVVKHPVSIDRPWGFDFLPNGDILITEKYGRLTRYSVKNQTAERVDGVPEVFSGSQGGLLDILVDPAFATTKRIFLTFSRRSGNLAQTVLARAVLDGARLTGLRDIFVGLPGRGTAHHFGSRVRMAPDGSLFVSHGDRGSGSEAQNLRSHLGSIMRIMPDGSVPDSNPFVGQSDALPEIYSYGHRNPQGMSIHPLTGDVWAGEHGAKGGDEINIIQKGQNYGWPVISYGTNYDGSKIGIGRQKAGMVQPLYYWDPSIAPGGMSFYFGAQFPRWKGNLLVSSLKFGLIARLTVENNRVTAEERLFDNQFGRIRDVKETPSGTVMFITDSSPGGLYEIMPVP